VAAYTEEVDASTITLAVARRPRAFVGVTGPDAADYLQRMLSNDVEALSPGESCEALLLTPKARVIAPMRVVRRAADDFLLLTEPELGETLREQLVRMRFAAKAEIELEEHTSTVVFGGEADGFPTEDYGEPAVEALDVALEPTLDEGELEVLRIEAGTPAWGKEIDDRVLPAEAGLVERAVSLTKGCYPGQEPIARLHYRGHANRGLRVLVVDGDELPEPDAELRLGEKNVGRVTSAARSNGRIVALAYVRVEVPPDAVLGVGSAQARPLH
jgi:folate-binding protein YgfZ